MSFTLNLSFGGLCLFVPEYDGDRVGQMHVLLPTCENHEANLVYNEAALTAGAKPLQAPKAEPLDKVEFDLTVFSTNRTLDPPPSQVVNLTTLFDARVPRDLLTGASDLVNTRIRFGSGTSRVPRCGGGGYWFFPDAPTPSNPQVPSPQLPIRVTWTLEIEGAFLPVQITRIDGSAQPKTLPLYPYDGNLDLWVFNILKDSLPRTLPPLNVDKEPDPLEAATHFTCFYPLTDKPTGDRVPRFHHLGNITRECFPKTKDAGLDLMCIGAQALPAMP